MNNTWLAQQPIELQQEIVDVKQWIATPATLDDLLKLDERFIHNSPEGEVVTDE